ncbi:ParA family protein [Sphingomonas nostoxanthinifaciens]|uniref:ParA family protein n=1 Tax=Sphingomonas nostoxanthinifaciens TaxID=2872652 RepID=UPI001CC1E707|nr:ParA family protein [Sphingomonas nostoxanthinifaciens]UAK24539.1 ParA family protein [Sphingomonas nostoxanthinifaciens]
MATLAVYSSKGGVGKTSLSVNLAWAAATLSSRKTLLWDLDAQGAASFILAPDRKARDEARAVIERDVAPEKVIVPTGIANLDLLPADASLRTLDLLFSDIGANKRLRKIGETLAQTYDRIVIDCPPGLGVTAEQVIRGATLILVPLIPSALSTRAAEELRQHLDQRGKSAPPVLSVFNLVDRRRLAHRAALAAAPDQPAIPMASVVEQMAERHAPVGVYARNAPVTKAITGLWTTIERRLAKG